MQEQDRGGDLLKEAPSLRQAELAGTGDEVCRFPTVVPKRISLSYSLNLLFPAFSKVLPPNRERRSPQKESVAAMFTRSAWFMSSKRSTFLLSYRNRHLITSFLLPREKKNRFSFLRPKRRPTQRFGQAQRKIQILQVLPLKLWKCWPQAVILRVQTFSFNARWLLMKLPTESDIHSRLQALLIAREYSNI